MEKKRSAAKLRPRIQFFFEYRSGFIGPLPSFDIDPDRRIGASVDRLSHTRLVLGGLSRAGLVVNFLRPPTAPALRLAGVISRRVDGGEKSLVLPMSSLRRRGSAGTTARKVGQIENSIFQAPIPSDRKKKPGLCPAQFDI